MSKEPYDSSLPGRGLPFTGSWTAWGNTILLLVAAVTLAFLVWHIILDGTAARESETFRAVANEILLLLCLALAFSLLLDAWNVWQEGLRRKELPPRRGTSSVRERIFRTEGPARPLFRYCTEELDRHFRRFYAFHRFQAPYVAYLYYAKKGSLSLLGLPSMKTGFLLLFLVGHTTVARGGKGDLLGWESIMSAAGCSFVIAGFLICAVIPYHKVWLRIVEENNRICLTLSCYGRSKSRWFETFCRSIKTQSGVVSCSIHAK